MKITRLGHATLLLETDRTRLLIDPGVFSAPETFDLVDLDGIVVTHQHPDHLDPERARDLADRNPAAILVADPQTAEQQGDRWQPNRDGLRTTIGDLTVTGVGSEHAQILPDLPIVANVGVLVGDGRTTLFHPGDSYDTVPTGVDVLALPLVAPWAKISETVRFAAEVDAAHLLPIHDALLRDEAHGVYWGHVETYGGNATMHPVAPGETLER